MKFFTLIYEMADMQKLSHEIGIFTALIAFLQSDLLHQA